MPEPEMRPPESEPSAPSRDARREAAARAASELSRAWIDASSLAWASISPVTAAMRALRARSRRAFSARFAL
jgi:hypothetical protein